MSSFVGWLGYSAAIVVAVSLLSALTLTPALLGWLGPRVNRLALPGRRHVRAAGAEELDGTLWARLAGRVARRPWTTALVSTVILLVLAAPVLFLRLGQMDAGQLPPSTQSRRAYDLLATGFGPGANGPLRVVVELYQPAAAPAGAKVTTGTDPRTLDPRLVALGATVARTDGVRMVSTPVVSPDGAVAVYAVTQTTSPSDAATVRLVDRLRGDVLPTALAGSGAEGHVGGLTATKSDLAARIAQRLPYLILGVVALACLLMLLAFRSIWLAVKAAVLNLISIAAAYGVVVAVFQWGWGIKLIGLDGPVPIESYVPMMMFAILFGLSMDYEVFLLSSVQEHWHATGDNTRAVRLGLADTGQIISSAALIMVSVFGSFLINNSPIVKMFGLGLSVAVAVDATIVRCLLVPAVMVLFGQRQWSLPARLDAVLPRIAIDPDPAVFDAYTKRSDPAATDHRAAAGGHARGGGLVSALLLGLVVVIGAVAAGSVARAAMVDVPLLLGALVAAISTAVPAGLRRSTVIALGIGSSPLSRVVGLCLGVGLAALAGAIAASRFPALPSAAGLTLGLTFLLAAVPAMATRNRIPLLALWAGALGFTVVGALAGAVADGTPATTGSIAARVLLWSAVGFVLVLLGELPGRLVRALRRRAGRRRRHRADEAELHELLESETPMPAGETR